MKVFAFILIALLCGCVKQFDHDIHIVKKDGKYAVWDGNMEGFIYRTNCDSAVIDKDSIVIGFLVSPRCCYWQSKTFRGYLTRDSAETATEKWIEYGYLPE